MVPSLQLRAKAGLDSPSLYIAGGQLSGYLRQAGPGRAAVGVCKIAAAEPAGDGHLHVGQLWHAYATCTLHCGPSSWQT